MTRQHAWICDDCSYCDRQVSARSSRIYRCAICSTHSHAAVIVALGRAFQCSTHIYFHSENIIVKRNTVHNFTLCLSSNDISVKLRTHCLYTERACVWFTFCVLVWCVRALRERLKRSGAVMKCWTILGRKVCFALILTTAQRDLSSFLSNWRQARWSHKLINVLVATVQHVYGNNNKRAHRPSVQITPCHGRLSTFNGENWINDPSILRRLRCTRADRGG